MSKGKEGKVIIIDEVINQEKDEHDVTTTKLLFDAVMMALVIGKERNNIDPKNATIGYSRVVHSCVFTHNLYCKAIAPCGT